VGKIFSYARIESNKKSFFLRGNKKNLTYRKKCTSAYIPQIKLLPSVEGIYGKEKKQAYV